MESTKGKWKAEERSRDVPGSIIVVGAGVFGLSTFASLLDNPRYDSTELTLVDTHLPLLSPTPSTSAASSALSTKQADQETALLSQNPHAASIDSSRIIRPDYANSAYAKLAIEAQDLWRKGYGTCPAYQNGIENRHSTGGGSSETRCTIKGCNHGPVYRQTGLILTAGKDGCQYINKAYNNAEMLGLDVEELSGWQDISRSLENGGQKQKSGHITKWPTSGEDAGRMREDRDERAAMIGETGYANWSSGWADAGKAMYNVLLDTMRKSRERNLDLKKGKITFIRGQVTRLLMETSSKRAGEIQGSHGDEKAVKGVSIITSNAILDPKEAEERHVHADITLLAGGAYTSSIVDLGSQIKATAQVVAYMPLTAAQAATLKDMPVILNLSTGIFIIEPALAPDAFTTGYDDFRQKEEAKPYVLKIARHSYGYTNPVSIDVSNISSSPSTNSPSQQPHLESENQHRPTEIIASLPHPDYFSIPARDVKELERSLRATLPHLFSPPVASPRVSTSTTSSSSSSQSVFSRCRLCWYTDTPKGDFLVTFHPSYRNLFLATGGSGHAFKFLPVLGDRILEVLEAGLLGKEGDEGGSISPNGLTHEKGSCKTTHKETLGHELRELWKWKTKPVGPENEGNKEAESDWQGTEDGSRSGGPNPDGVITLAQAFALSATETSSSHGNTMSSIKGEEKETGKRTRESKL